MAQAPRGCDLSEQWIDGVHWRRPPKLLLLDVDSSESPIHGDGEGCAYNGRFGYTCYDRLFKLNQFSELEQFALQCSTADEWKDSLRVIVARRGTCEQFKSKSTIKCTRLSCRSFAANAARL